MKRNKSTRYSIRSFWNKKRMDKETKESVIVMVINLNGRQFKICLNLKVTYSDYERAILSNSTRNLSDAVKEIREAWNGYLLKAETVLTRLNNPNQEVFTKFFKSEADLSIASRTSMIPYFEMKIQRMFSEDRFSSCTTYKLALRSLKKYNLSKYHKSEINFEDIDLKFLNGYVRWMTGVKGNSTATTGIYLRNLRSIFNDSIKDGVIDESCYPFKRFVFKSGIKSKEVLYPAQLKQLLNYETTNEREQKAIAYFFFCYTCNGMNFQDAALLQYKNIKGDVMTFIRKKTRTTGKVINVYMHDLSRKIIEEYGNKNTAPDDYIFGLVEPGMTPYEIQIKLNKVKNSSNQILARIGRELKFDVHLCLNLARHSFATTLKINNTSVAAISDAMGHTSTNTNEHYMKSLPSENLKIMSNSLLAF